jgi:hypothetical protein
MGGQNRKSSGMGSRLTAVHEVISFAVIVAVYFIYNITGKLKNVSPLRRRSLNISWARPFLAAKKTPPLPDAALPVIIVQYI